MRHLTLMAAMFICNRVDRQTAKSNQRTVSQDNVPQETGSVLAVTDLQS